MRRRGYNLVRFHFLDAALMAGRYRDFDFDPEKIDRLHYLMAALKRQGVYWLVDALSSENGAYGNVRPHRFVVAYDLKRDVYFRPDAQEHWKDLVRKMLAVNNKYTGSTILKDPALLAVNLVNEGGLQFTLRKGIDSSTVRDIQEWASRRKVSSQTGQETPLRQSTIAKDPSGLFTEIEIETADWMTRELRSLGYKGLVTSYSNGDTLQAAAVRSKLGLVSFHIYHDHPTDYVERGSRQAGGSSFDDGLSAFRSMAFNRQKGKPYILQEYGQPYWNTWRREAGLTIPAYAALQGWDGICHFANPVELEYGYDAESPVRTKAIYPFNIGLDPIARAGEVLAALLYRRGDVIESESRIVLKTAFSEISDPRRGMQGIPDDISRLALVTRVGLEVAGAEQKQPATLRFENSRLARVPLTEPVHQLSRKPQEDWRIRRKELAMSGLLDDNNKTADDGSTYHSDTGQILVSLATRSMRVFTPQTEAALFEKGCPFPIASITIQLCTTPALISVSALDSQPLRKSHRILIIVATDAVNSGASFLFDRRVLVNLGHLPVRIRTTRLRLTAVRDDDRTMQLFALDMAGNRTEQLPVTQSTGRINLDIDTAILKNGAAIFFELVSAPG
jgi:hypothetical protein